MKGGGQREEGLSSFLSDGPLGVPGVFEDGNGRI